MRHENLMCHSASRILFRTKECWLELRLGEPTTRHQESVALVNISRCTLLDLERWVWRPCSECLTLRFSSILVPWPPCGLWSQWMLSSLAFCKPDSAVFLEILMDVPHRRLYSHNGCRWSFWRGDHCVCAGKLIFLKEILSMFHWGTTDKKTLWLTLFHI